MLSQTPHVHVGSHNPWGYPMTVLAIATAHTTKRCIIAKRRRCRMDASGRFLGLHTIATPRNPKNVQMSPAWHCALNGSSRARSDCHLAYNGSDCPTNAHEEQNGKCTEQVESLWLRLCPSGGGIAGVYSCRCDRHGVSRCRCICRCRHYELIGRALDGHHFDACAVGVDGVETLVAGLKHAVFRLESFQLDRRQSVRPRLK